MSELFLPGQIKAKTGGDLSHCWRRLVGTLAVLLLGWGLAPSVSAHNMPISYLTMSVDEAYVHLELLLNPFELAFFSQIDDNGDGRLEAAEMSKHQDALAAKVGACLKLEADGQPLPMETSGLDPQMEGHHIRFRGHWRGDVRRRAFTLESTLAGMTIGSHVTQVTCQNGERRQLAQLDPQSARVTFGAAEAAETAASLPAVTPTAVASGAPSNAPVAAPAPAATFQVAGILMVMVLLLGLVGVVALVVGRKRR